MKNWIFFLALVALSSACAADKTEQQKATQASDNAMPAPASGKDNETAKRTIVFFGNSLTAAYNLSPEQGFTALIQQRMDSLSLPWRVVNAGLSGETTADGVNRVDWVLRQPVDMFVLELGGNDALRGLPVAVSRRNLQRILDKVKARYPQAKLVLAGMQAPPNLGRAYTAAFRQMFVDLAKTNNAVLIPFLLEGVGGHPELNLEDGIHPNAAGQKIVARTVWTVLRPHL